MSGRDPFANYDAWLTTDHLAERADRVSEQREAAEEELRDNRTDAYRETLVEWIGDRLYKMGTVDVDWPRTKTWGEIIDEYEASPEFEALVDNICEEWNSWEPSSE